MMLALSLTLITLLASGVEPFKISKGPQQQQQLGQQNEQLNGELPPFQQQGPQFVAANQWDLRGQLREQEYAGGSQQEYNYNHRPPAYYPSVSRPTLTNYEQDYTREQAIRGSTGGYLEKDGFYSQQPLTRQPQYASPSVYGTQQLALVLIRPLQLSGQQQHFAPEQYPSYASLLVQAPPQPPAFGGGQRPEQIPLPPPDQQQQQQFGGVYGATGGDKFGGVFAKSHEKLSKLKSHLERFAQDAKAKLNLGSTYHYNGEETLPGPNPQPFPQPAPLPAPPQPGFRPQLVARPLGAPFQQQQQQGQLELADIQLSKQEQEKIRDNQHQEKLEQQQELAGFEQEQKSSKESVPLPIKHQQVVVAASEEQTSQLKASDSNEGFGRRQAVKTL